MKLGPARKRQRTTQEGRTPSNNRVPGTTHEYRGPSVEEDSGPRPRARERVTAVPEVRVRLLRVLAEVRLTYA